MQRAFCSVPDVPLNERGMRQSEQLAQRLFAHGFVHILCSDLLRARMTAAPPRCLLGDYN